MLSGIDKSALKKGFLAYICWGFFPIYWKLLKRFPALEILAQRLIWAAVFYSLVYVFKNASTRQSLSDQKKSLWALSLLSATILAVNWCVYIYAVNAGYIVESSLAYFINPLLNVVVGVLFFAEPFPVILRVAVGFAACGVGIKMYFSPQFPWIALVLATTFCSYGALKKRLKVTPELSSFMEGVSLLLPAIAMAIYFRRGSELSVSPYEWMLFVGSGVVTGLPLFLFAGAAQKIPYSLMGMMQFIAPTLQFLVGSVLFHEPMTAVSLLGFGFVWFGVALYFLYNSLAFLR